MNTKNDINVIVDASAVASTATATATSTDIETDTKTATKTTTETETETESDTATATATKATVQKPFDWLTYYKREWTVPQRDKYYMWNATSISHQLHYMELLRGEAINKPSVIIKNFNQIKVIAGVILDYCNWYSGNNITRFIFNTTFKIISSLRNSSMYKILCLRNSMINIIKNNGVTDYTTLF